MGPFKWNSRGTLGGRLLLENEREDYFSLNNDKGGWILIFSYIFPFNKSFAGWCGCSSRQWSRSLTFAFTCKSPQIFRNVKEIKKTWFQWFASKKFAYFLQANANCCIFTMLTSNKFLISIQNYLMAIFKHWNMHAGPKKKKKSVQPVVERRNFNLNLPFDGLAWKLNEVH